MTDTSPSTDTSAGNLAIRQALAGLPKEFQGFDQIFEERIRPALLAREEERIKVTKRAILMRWITGGVIAAGLAIAFLSQMLWIAIVAGFIGIILFAGGEHGVSQLAKEAKGLIVVPIAEQFGLNFTSEPGPVESIYRHKEVGVVPGWDRSKYEDYITGVRREVNFELFEAHLEEKRTTTDSKGRTRTTWVTVFKGQCLRLDFHKTFYGRTLVTRDAGFFNRFGGGKGMQRAGLEDPTFEKIFEVYTTDQVESRYLLTPDVMQKLVDLEQVFKGGKLKACFDGGEVLITVQGGNLFEPGSMFKPLDSADRVRELLEDFNAIFNIIDEITAGRIRVEQNHS
ncbi:hypothetical protein BBF93_07535 [Hyphomonas sp. CACIAM 19H1]|uniref:DUF3137 domain-containing protein n=1 Tax=Hyphomonas sp. CACIAM 19H1 TaxID=1873716 RepID=UPI000DEE070B|nr:DUF3137 domain-containing protein [Hyphomonas sp. CACIAM 19H1]AXE64089.1 hypothetical protein BBF93_07535 [Hyphomonas sp. CACIAM 19H1]